MQASYPDGSPYTETDTREKLINPTLFDLGWTEKHLQRERSPGSIVVDATGRGKRDTERVDYMLSLPIPGAPIPLPIGVIEAKAAGKPYKLGLEQAKAYAARLHVPFVFSSNGYRVSFYDSFTGITLDLDLYNFPTPHDLRQRYEEHTGIHLDSADALPLLAAYKGGLSARRYYQDAAIRASLEKVARGGSRVLISMATGTGKTLTAVHLLRKLADSKQLRKALFICDRTALAEQAHATLSRFFGDEAQIVSGKDPKTNARILVATYQTLNVGGDPAEQGEARHDGKFFLENYRENEFDVVIIDECHRSAWGEWSVVLTRNAEAIQIGLTATPRILAGTPAERSADEQITANNLAYFGEPVYEYTIARAQADGYLAAAEILKRISSLDRLGGIGRDELAAKHPIDPITGEPLSPADLDALYTNHDYNRILILPDLVRTMCEDLFERLVARGDPHQKTIVFWARDIHADEVATQLNNCYARWCGDNGVKRREAYAFKLTSASYHPQALLTELKGARRSHYIATTVDLLSTGIDVPWLENIVFFSYIESPIRFYQMLGRGTRIAEGKLTFRIYDYTDAGRLLGQDFVTQARATQPVAEAPVSYGGEPGGARPRRRQVEAHGFTVTIDELGHYIMVDRDGQETAVSIEEYEQDLARRLLPLAPTLDDLRLKWIDPDERKNLLDALPRRASGARVLQFVKSQDDYDLYDVLADAVYHAAPKRRLDRAYDLKRNHASWLRAKGQRAEKVLLALVGQFEQNGIDELENPAIWRTPAVRATGGVGALGDVGERSADLLMETKRRLFAA